jgi:hypothetical protein
MSALALRDFLCVFKHSPHGLFKEIAGNFPGFQGEFDGFSMWKGWLNQFLSGQGTNWNAVIGLKLIGNVVYQFPDIQGLLKIDG